MATSKSTNPVTRAERMELALCANVQIQGLSDELLRMVREQNIDCEAPRHHAVLGMLATISALSDDIFTLVFSDQDDEVTREQADEIMRKLGLEEINVVEDAAEASHG